MDILMIEAVTAELQEKLAGSRIDKIFQPEADILILRLWNGRENLRLLLSPAQRFPRLHLSEQSFPNPAAPPRFCQLLRARLSRLQRIALVPNERIVHLHCSGPGGEAYLLAVELVGRRSNLVLVDGDGFIVDLWKREKQESAARILLPGQPYQLPAPRLLTPLSEVHELPEDRGAPDEVARWLFRTLTPMSSFVAAELAAGLQQGRSLSKLVEEIIIRRGERDYAPTVGRLEGAPFISAFPVHFVELEDVRHFNSPSEAAEYYFQLAMGEAGELGEKRQLLQRVARQLARINARIEKIRQEERRLAEGEGLREKGELLLANLYRISAGMHQIQVEDYYRDPPQPLTINLDPRLSAAQNAEQYFRRYKKGRRGAEHIARRLQESQQERDWLESVQHALEQAQEAVDVTAVRHELEEAGLLASQGRLGKRPVTDPRSRVRSAVSPGGYRIFWGRNNRTNDYVTRELAAPQDWWFHAQGMPGCHLVLKVRNRGEEIPDEDMLFAAALAAGYSKGSAAGKVEVMVARAADVRKPKGAPAGLVSVQAFTTLRVEPKKMLE